MMKDHHSRMPRANHPCAMHGGAALLKRAALAGAVSLCVGSAQAIPTGVSDNLTFETLDQSMWGPGQGDLIDRPFTLPVIDIDTGPQSIGSIGELSESIPNPAYLAWSVAWSACRAVFSASVCRNGGTIPFVGRVGGLGSAPAETLTVSLGKNGLKLSSDIDLEAGFKGGIVLDGGKVDVLYPTQVMLQADQDRYVGGQPATLHLVEVAGTPTMSTEFSDLDMSVKSYIDVDISAGVEAWVAGIGGGNATNIVDWDTYNELELLGLGIGGNLAGEKDVQLRALGLPPLEFDTSGGIGANIPLSIDYPSPESPIKIPIADVQAHIPELDTPPNSAWDGTRLTNTQLPIDRQVEEGDLTLIGGGSGFHPTDVLKMDLDVDGVISAGVFSTTGVPAIFGLAGGVTGVLTLEGNLIDFDMGAFFGLGQTMSFTPTLMAELAFNMPVMVKNADGVYEEVMHWSMAVGDQLDLIFPNGDLIVSPTYYLDNTFSNLTEFLISPVATLAILQIKLSGLAAAFLGITTDLALYQNVFPLSDPISAATMFNDTFSLEGFDPQQGTSLNLTRIRVPEPHILLLFGTGVVAVRLARRRPGGASSIEAR